MKKIFKAVRKMGIVVMSMLLSTSIAFAANTNVSGGALTEAAKQGAEGLSKEAVSALPYLLLIVLLVAGISLIVLGRRGKESVKELAPQVIIGIALVVFASPIALWMIGLFNK